MESEEKAMRRAAPPPKFHDIRTQSWNRKLADKLLKGPHHLNDLAEFSTTLSPPEGRLVGPTSKNSVSITLPFCNSLKETGG